MAGRKGRAFRTRSWFLLKDSVIFVLVMCLLHIQIQLVMATEDSNSNTGHDRKRGVVVVGSTGHQTMATLISTATTTTTPTPSPSPETPVTSVKTPPPLSWAVHPAKATSTSINSGRNSSKSSRNSTIRILKNIKIKGMNENVIRENIMLPSFDSEREAQLLYEKTLQEYHGGSRSDSTVTDKTTPQQATTERTVHSICELWIARKCHCHGRMDRISLACRGLDMLAVPLDIPAEVVNLDLGNNNLTHLGDNSFYMVPNLEELTLSDNSLSDIHQNAFSGLVKLKRLSLQNCGLKVIPGDSFQGLPNLISLQLNGNSLASMDTDSLRHLQNLRTLRLEGNLFYRIPTNALAGLRSLEALNLGSNLLTIITDEDFPVMPNLIVLLLKRNQIMKTSPGAFTNITALKVLELDDNLLTSLPEGLNKLNHLQELSASSNRLKWINETDLPKNLHTIDFRANPLKGIRRGAFSYMPRLRKL